MQPLERIVGFWKGINATTIALVLMTSCAGSDVIEITAPFRMPPEGPTLEAVHAALEEAARKSCPFGHEFGDSPMTFSVEHGNAPGTVTMKVRCLSSRASLQAER